MIMCAGIIGDCILRWVYMYLELLWRELKAPLGMEYSWFPMCYIVFTKVIAHAMSCVIQCLATGRLDG